MSPVFVTDKSEAESCQLSESLYRAAAQRTMSQLNNSQRHRSLISRTGLAYDRVVAVQQ
jgi:hypothetical protein